MSAAITAPVLATVLILTFGALPTKQVDRTFITRVYAQGYEQVQYGETVSLQTGYQFNPPIKVLFDFDSQKNIVACYANAKDEKNKALAEGKPLIFQAPQQAGWAGPKWFHLHCFSGFCPQIKEYYAAEVCGVKMHDTIECCGANRETSMYVKFTCNSEKNAITKCSVAKNAVWPARDVTAGGKDEVFTNIQTTKKYVLHCDREEKPTLVKDVTSK